MDHATLGNEVIPTVQFGPQIDTQHVRDTHSSRHDDSDDISLPSLLDPDDESSCDSYDATDAPEWETLDAMTHVRYQVSLHHSHQSRGSLIDRGANGGILGNDANVILKHSKCVNVTGIDNHELSALRMVDASARIDTQLGPVIVILRQYAYHGTGRTIHSAGQIEHYKNEVHDKSMKVGGKQCIRTLDGYVIPLDVINGLPYMKMCPNTKKEFEDLPHVVLTGGVDWNPKVLDNTITDKEGWYNTMKAADDGLIPSPFDEYGNYRHRTPETQPAKETAIDIDPTYESNCVVTAFHAVSNLNMVYLMEGTTDETQDVADETDNTTVQPRKEVKPKPIDYHKYRPYFLNVPVEKVRETFKRTTRYATNVMSGSNILQTIRSPYPAHNVRRRNEPVATDTIFAETPAVDCGHTMAQIFVGRKTRVIDVYGMSTKMQFVNTLEDVIRKRGAMDKLTSDHDSNLMSRRVLDILRALCIDDWQSEPQYQHQNFAEHAWKHLKRNVNWIMNWRNVDAHGWLLCLMWVADVMNHTAERSLGWRPPLEVLTGQTVDISILLCFMFWDVVYFTRYENDKYQGQIGSESSSEVRGRFVGFSWSVGHALTFKVLSDESKRVLSRSRIRLASTGENNLKLDIKSGALPSYVYVKSKRDHEDPNVVLPTIDISDDPIAIELESVPGNGETNPNKSGEPTGEPNPNKPNETTGEPTGEPTTTPVVETVQDDDDQDHALTNVGDSPLDSTPLRDVPLNEDDHADIPVDDLADHLKHRRAGEPNPTEEPLKFITEQLDTINPTQLVPPDQMKDRTFLMPPTDDGTRVRAKILRMIDEHKKDVLDHPELIKFKCLVNNEYEEVVAYNDIVDFIERDDTWDGKWKFREILDHEGPLHSKHGRYKGSKYNLKIEWETGEITWEPLKNILKDDPITLAIYARKHDLLGRPGWGHSILKKYAKTQQRMIRHASQAKLHSFRTKPIYMYGYQVPRNYQQAMELDRENGNDKWAQATKVEMAQIMEYEAFKDMGKGYRPDGYKRINVHLVYAVKHDGRHKARLVAGGHLTDTPIDSVYSSVVSLRGIRLVTFIGELNDLQIWGTDIGNAYLESLTKERVYVVAGPEFGELEGHTLIIFKALYGLKSSGLRWHERFADVLRSMNFFPSKAESDIWMRDKGDHYEYIAVYVDDLLIASKNPQDIIDDFTGTHDFKLKGTGPVSFHLGCDFFRDEDGNLCYAPRKYIEQMLENYRRIYGRLPRPAHSPLVKGDHPEIDTSPLLDLEGIKIYQSLIGALQWVIQIGRFDIATAVMTLSRFRAAPRQGHMDRIHRIHGYLMKFKCGVIRIRTEEPDYSDVPEKIYEWAHTCYKGAKEIVPEDTPTPKGKSVKSTSYVDANLYHDLISGRSVSGILHLLNKTPIDWFSKLQTTVETATFGSEYVAARTCTEQIIDLRTTLRYLGIPLEGSSMMFGDNESVVNTASIPHSKLTKRHNALSYHKTRSAIAAGILRFHYVRSEDNPADILSKHWDMPSVWDTLKPLMFWRGDTADIKGGGDEQASRPHRGE